MADYGFDLDGTLTGNLTTERPLPRLSVYDNPRLVPFGELLTIRPGGDLVIKGSILRPVYISIVNLGASLNVAATSRDLKVSVGGKSCNVTALATSTLTCQLGNELGFEDLEVVVFIGDLSESIGYVSQNTARNNNSSWLIVAFVIAFIGVFLTITLFILYKRKSNKHNRQLHYLKNQMQTIEMKVAQECKAAFVELQTNMNALAHSAPQGSSFIPLLSYRDYIARILVRKFRFWKKH